MTTHPEETTMDRSQEALLQTSGLNLGSGPHYAPGWVNVDVWDAREQGFRGPDVVASVFDLSVFPDDSFTACYLGHFLEHLPWGRIPEAFREIRRVCRPGATVMAVGPCILRAIQTKQPADLILAIVADPRAHPDDGGAHSWTPTEELTRVALLDGGLTDVFTVPIVGVAKPTWPNPSTAPWQTAAQGTVPPPMDCDPGMMGAS